MKPRLTIPLLCCLTAALTIGCNTMNGTLDGQDVGPIRSAIFDDFVPANEDERQVQYWVRAGGIEDSCAFYRDKRDMDVDSCETRCVDLAVLAEDHLDGDEYWSLELSLAHYSWDDADTYEIGSPFDCSKPADSSALIRFIQPDDWLDVDTCIADCEAGLALTESSFAMSGEVKITVYREEAQLSGKYTVQFEDGEVSGTFSAQYCDLGYE